MTFPCTKCGLCCRDIREAKRKSVEAARILRKPLIEMKVQHDENGQCEHYDKDVGCKVYASRPMMCRIDEMAVVLQIPRRKAYENQADYCNKLMEDNGYPDVLKVVL